MRRGSPWVFGIGRWLVRHRLRGGYRLIDWAERRGWLNCRALYRLGERVEIEMPLYRRANQVDACEAREYERSLVAAVSGAIEGAGRPAVLADCGADIGLFSALVAARTRRLRQVLALEPNGEVFAILERNVGRLPVPGRALCLAAGARAGRGTLREPDYDGSPHARYAEPGTDGTVEIVALDDLKLAVRDATLALKVDVEGGERDVILGASRTIAEARDAVVAFEAHPLVRARTGIDPCDVLRALLAVRPMRWWIAERPDVAVALDRPLFEQASPPAVLNIVCVSCDA